MEAQAQALTQTAISKAPDGDSFALRLCLDGIMPSRKDRCVEAHLSQIREPRDLLGSARVLILAVQTDELAPLEGNKVMSLLEKCQKLFLSVDFEERIEVLENKILAS